jgi:hypothetical protein
MRKKNKADFDSNWIIIAPISGLWLSEAIQNELKVGNVIFVTKNKLPRIRKRLGIKKPVSKLSEIGLNNQNSIKESLNDFFKYSKTYAVLNFSGTPKENQNKNIRLIEEAINIISFSNLGYSTRKFNSKIHIKNSKYVLNNKTLVIDKKQLRLRLGNKSIHPIPLELNERWKNFHGKFYFHKLLKLVNGEIKIKSKWKKTLISVAKLVGKSLNSHDIPESFLKNVIALEMLLVNQNEKIEEKIIERSRYLLEWCDEWEEKDIETKIKEMYKKRCDYVHDGKYDDIRKEDLIFTDDLIFNIYNNLLKNTDKIISKGKLIEFSYKYMCEKELNLKSKFQFGKFQYMSKTYEKSDLKNI